MKEMTQQTKGIFTHVKERGITLMLPTLDVVDVTRAEYILWDLIGKGKSADELNSEMKKIFCDITEEKIEEILKILHELCLIHPPLHSKGGKALSFEERLLIKNSRGKFLLLRKNLIEKDESLHCVTFLPAGETFTLDSLLAALGEILPHVSRSPVFQFFDAEHYIDAASLRKIVVFMTSRMLYERPLLVVEVNSVFINGALQGLMELLKAPKYQCLDLTTQGKRFLGKNLTSSGDYDFSTDDANLFILLRIDTPEDVENFKYLDPYPGKTLGVSFKISKEDQVQTIEKFLEKYSIPVFLRFESHTLIPYFFLHFLNEERVLFIGDDLYRLKGAFIKNYFPVTNCGAGKRKILFTPDGKVYPCLPAVEEGYSIGNIKEGIESVMKSEMAINLQNNISERFNECKDKCSFAYFCGGCFSKRRCIVKYEIIQDVLEGQIE